MPLESGLRSHRIEYIRETTPGVTPADPTWDLFGDVVREMNAAPGLDISERRGIGDADPVEFSPGREEPTAMVEWELQRAFGSDPINDAFVRLTDNGIWTHSIVDRESKASGGADGAGRRLYKVIKGAYPSTGQLRGDPQNTAAVVAMIEYNALEVRSYLVDQPSAGTTLEVVSTDAADTSQTVTIEDDGGTTEALALNGVTPVTGATSFSSIDAISLDAQTAGNVEVRVSGGGGNLLAVLYGTTAYDGAKGDLGIPLIGSGSHASALGTAYENFIGDTLTRGGSQYGDCLSLAELSVDNGLEVQPCNKRAPVIEVGTRQLDILASVTGDKESHDAMITHLQAVEADMVWTLTNSVLTLQDAVLIEPGEWSIQAEQAIMVLQNRFRGKGLLVA